MTPDFPIAIDSTMRSAFVSCPKKFELAFLRQYAHPVKSIHLVCGQSLAKGLEVARKAFWQEHKSSEEALLEGQIALIKEYENPDLYQEDKKSLERTVLALDEYFLEYKWEADHIQPYVKGDRVCVENTFAFPTEVDHPQTGEPILYCGRFDLIGEYAGQVFVVDEKTTGQMGDTWAKQWRLRGQITGYCHACAQFDIPVAGAVIRGIAFYAKSYKFQESIQYRPDWEIERWWNQIQRDIRRMVSCWREGYFDWNLDSECGSYGGCQFVDACSQRDPHDLLEFDFVKREWNPLQVT